MPEAKKTPTKVPRWTRAEILTARRLFLVNRWTPVELAEKFGRTPQSVSNLVWREGWTDIRKKADERAAEQAGALALSAAQEFQASCAARGEELAEKSFDLAESAADDGDAKGLAFASSAAKNFVGITRQALGMDAQQVGLNVTLHGVFSRPAEKNVTPSAIATPSEVDLDFS